MPARPPHLPPLRKLLAFLAALTCTTAALAQTGAITGRVTDASTGMALGGARVAVPGTNLVTFAGPSGDYVLPNVPAGSRSIEVSYVGYPARTEPITVTDGGSAQLNVLFGEDVVTLDTITIQGAAVGSARAINQQRAADTLTNIAAADAIGNFPDQNAAEALQRLPGLSLYRDQGEGRYIVLRGLNYTYTSVKVNNGSFAGADLGERATALDVIPADAISSIEVTKVPTPDMDGEGLGGQVNIKTKSPLDYEGTAASITTQGIYSKLTEDLGYKFNALYSVRFGDDGKYGLLISPSFEKREFGSDNFETGGAWVSPSATNGLTNYFMEELGYREYEIERERNGVTAAFEARLDADTTVFLRGGYNRFTDKENRFLTLFIFGDGAITSLSEKSATVTGSRLFARRLRIREKDQEVYTVSAGGEKRMGNLKIDTHAGFTEGKETRPEEISARFRPASTPSVITYNLGDTYETPSITRVSGPDFASASAYTFQRIDLANESGRETAYDLGLNARYDLNTTAPAYLKAGLAFRAKEKTSEAEEYELGGNPANFNFASQNTGLSDYPFIAIPRPSAAIIKAGLDRYRPISAASRLFIESESEDWTTEEDVTAAYLMGGVTFGRLNLITGIRAERTEFTATGNLVTFNDNPATDSSIRQSRSRNYTSVLPGFYLRYDLTKNLVARASWSNSLARPGFSETAYRRLVDNEEKEVVEGNPGLDELTSENWDASIEYYLPSLGVLSASVFHKKVDNFSYEYTVEGGTLINGDPYDLINYGNGSDGSITGLELAYQQQLGFLPSPFNGLGVLANITLLDAEATYPTRRGETVPFIGQSEYVGNVGLTYENKKFFARLALNFRDERLRDDEPLGGSADADLYVDTFSQLDLSLRYKFNRHFEAFVEVLNLTNEPFRVYQLNTKTDGGKRLGQFEEYDLSANFGLRWKL